MIHPKLQVVGLCKSYPGTTALRDVSLSFDAGRVHALVGRNGAGKSTLVRILAGATQPTAGRILLDGREISISSPAAAFEAGIASVYQELSLVRELSVGENILLGRLPRRKGLAGLTVDWPEVRRRSRAVLDGMRVDLDVRQKAGDLSVARQQVVEIAKAMSFQPSVLILDEPTSSLAFHEVQALFELVRKLASRGVAVIYISHRLGELKEIADDISVLRDGSLMGTIPAAGATAEKIARLMFGEVVQRTRPADLPARDEPALEVRHLSRRGKLCDVNLTLRKGEVLGIAGAVGAGRTELLMSIFGAQPFDAGEILLDGRTVARPTPRLMKGIGVGLTPESRKEQGLILIRSIADNLCTAALRRIAFHRFIWKGRQRPVVERLMRDLRIAATDPGRPAWSLSGGNQQKVVVGNWLNTRPRVMLFDEPTRGVDLQAKQQIFQIIWDLCRQGISSIFVSSELEELIEVCHRILIMRNGSIIGEVRPDGLALDRLVAMCMED